MDRTKRRFLRLSLLVLVLDQWTKWLVETHLPVHSAHEVVPGLVNLTHVRNTGVAFGLFAEHGSAAGPWLLALLGVVALVVVTLYFLRTSDGDLMLLTALALVLGGAIGNLVDRVASGAVTDFIDVYVGTHHWPSFNVADSAISVGIVLMALDALRGARRPEPATS
jgi:signal peptidase II